VSTGGHARESLPEVVRRFLAHGIRHIELTSGCHEPGMLEKLSSYEAVEYQVHNYFPPPAVSFVFNLASLDDEIAVRSVQQVERGIEWAGALKTRTYSFHAGFLIDPDRNELGGQIARRAVAGRAEGLAVFLKRTNALASIAERQGIRLLVENNPLSAANFREFGRDPFLMTTPDECHLVMERTASNVGLLMDVGHAKVSARTLGFDAGELSDVCGPWIGGYHLSDNDGTADTNEAISTDSWFWPYVSVENAYVSLETYNATIPELRQQQLLVIEKIRRDGYRSQ